VATNNYICETEKIVAYIEGDLDPALRLALEEHLKDCAACVSELQSQRAFMCELDSALASRRDIDVPANFAEVVAVHAKSDMSGMRDRAEHARALRFCIVLGLAAFALLGVASSKAVLLNLKSIAGKVFGVLRFVGEALSDAAAGLVVVWRVISRGLITDSRFAGFAGLLFVVLFIAVLSRLIARYHRTRLIE